MSKGKTTKTGNLKKSLNGYFAQPCANTFENLDEINTFPEKYNLANEPPGGSIKSLPYNIL